MRYWVILLCLQCILTAGEVFRSPSVPPAVWNEVDPFLMSPDHPAKSILDSLFSNAGVIESRHTLRKAGFKVSQPRKLENIFIATHKKLKGYVIKLYTDDQGILPDWYNFIQRVKGAMVIQEIIDRHHYQSIFSVPKKWIYPIPRVAIQAEQKSFILVAEKINLISEVANAGRWKSRQWITEEKLKAVHTVLKEGKLIDSVYIDNIPFSKDGLIAFVDTEHFHNGSRPVPYERLTPRLHPNLQKIWTEMINQSPQN